MSARPARCAQRPVVARAFAISRNAFPLIACCVLALLLLPGLVHAQLRSTDFRLARDLDVKVLHGYPLTRHGYYGPLAFGVELRNRGGERQVSIDIARPTRMSRSLRVPAGERVRTFFALPVRTSYGSAATMQISDSASGHSRDVVAEGAYSTEEPLARLGPISTALNVDKPWTLVGALDGRMPDDWRALSGVRAIVVEHGYAVAHVSDWRVLMDWVAMGGVLLVSTPAASMGERTPWPAQLPFARNARETEAGLVQQIGYGAIVRLFPERLASLSGTSFLADIGVCEECRWSVSEESLQSDQPHRSALGRLQGYVAEPGWGLFGVLLLFASAVGPVGWIWLVKRRGAPLAYLAFVIANASVFSLTVLGHDLLENGITAKAVARSLVLIDQRSGNELGSEDAALYAPTGRGTRLRLPATGLALLPGASMIFDDQPMQVELADDRQLIAGGVPVRRRELAAVRWLRAQRGGLELEPKADGLWVENQTGFDLRGLVLWRGKASYRIAAIARGGRARAQPLGAELARSSAPSAPSDAVVGSAAPLARAIIAGELGDDRYVASYAWSPAVSALVDERVNSVSAGQHVLAGVF
jgi:hypothetical protein